MRPFDFTRSIIAGIRAGAALGRSAGFRDRGDLPKALAQAHYGLDLLREYYVRRQNPAEGSALASLTIMAEEVSMEIGLSGATINDLYDSIDLLNRLKGERQPDLCLWIPFLETRLALLQTPVNENLNE